MTRSSRIQPRTVSGPAARLRALIATAVAVALSSIALFVMAAPAQAAPSLLSQGQPTTASSTESTAYPASDATDGDTSTRWSSGWSDPQWLEVDLGSSATVSSVTLDWEAAYATGFQIQVSNDNATWTTIYSTTAGTGATQNLSVSGTGRYVRMYGTARATGYGYSLWEFQVYGSYNGSSCGTADAALNQPTTASSLENSSFPASAATDGNAATRWSSAWSDPQWLAVDLGATRSICGVALDWEAAYASAFQIQVSNDDSTWTTIYSTTAGTGGTQNLNITGSGRYIRMYGTARGTQYGYSLYEFDVYLPQGPGASSSPSASASASSTGSPGSGEPPASFWGNTSAIPAAKNVLEVAVVNQTNGQYPDSEVYWSFNGQEESIAQQPYVDMPANSAGRMYFYLGSPNSQYYDFIEFTVGSSSINLDTTRVDRFGLKLAILLHGHDGSNQEIGENYATFQESRSATFQRFENSVPTEFKELATDNAPYGIPSPGNDPAFQTGGAYANYFSAYAAANGDTSDSTAQIFGCGGTLAGNPTLCAALNRHVAGLSATQQDTPSLYYQSAPANYYAQFWHQNAINGVQYGFPYDDVDGQSSDISASNPQYMVVAVGW